MERKEGVQERERERTEREQQRASHTAAGMMLPLSRDLVEIMYFDKHQL